MQQMPSPHFLGIYNMPQLRVQRIGVPRKTAVDIITVGSGLRLCGVDGAGKARLYQIGG